MNKERNIKRIIGTTLTVGGIFMASWGLVSWANSEKDIETKLAENFPNVREVCTKFDRIPNSCYLKIIGNERASKEQQDELLESYRNYRAKLRRDFWTQIFERR